MRGKRIVKYSVVVVTLMWGSVSCMTPAGYQGPVSDHFNGVEFINQGTVASKSFADFLRWMWTREPGKWQEYTDALYGDRPPRHGASLRVTFVNHATVLVQTAKLNILTDPIWSQRASPVDWAGPKRVRPPGIRFEDLPPIDVVLVSHAHYDHMDLPTLRRLYQRDKPLILVGLGNESILEEADIGNVQAIDWWDRVDVSDGVTISGVPAQHFSMRWLNDRNERLWLGYVIETPEGKVFFAGDTGMGMHFKQIHQRFGTMKVSLLPIGAYKPRWFMAPVHLSPDEAVQAHQQLESEYSVGIHYGTFRLADDSQDDPVNDLAIALKQRQVSDERFWLLGFGEGRAIP